MRGITTTLRSEHVERELHKLLARHPTDEQVRLAHLKIGETFQEMGCTYTITDIFTDDLKRLIAVATLQER